MQSVVGENISKIIDLKVWLADLTYTQQTIAADVMPNAIASIAAYAENKLGFSEPIRLFKFPEKLLEALDKEGPPDVLGFSNYVWNGALTHNIASIVKTLSPSTLIVVGGPNYPLDHKGQEDYFSKHPEIDFYIAKEGEIPFTKLLESYYLEGFNKESVKLQHIPGLHSLRSNGQFMLPAATERLLNLDEIPSPYTTGKLDEFFDGLLLPIVQTNRGCPFSCTFCVEGDRYYQKIHKNGVFKIAAELDYIGKKMMNLRSEGGRNDLFIADSNFGMFKDDLETCREIARTREIYGWPEYINVATGKNQKERVLEASRLVNGALRLSGSVQSFELDPSRWTESCLS